MNFIYTAVSTFMTNYFIMFIIRILPLRKKRIWNISIVSIYNLSICGLYIQLLFTPELDLNLLIYCLGNLLGIAIAQLASFMLIFEGVKLFKSRRLKEFERNLNNKEGTSIPKWIFATLLLVTAFVLGGYTVFALINYNKSNLMSIIGSIIFGIIALGFSIYLFICGRAAHKKINSSKLMFIVGYPNETVIYTADLNKEFTIKDALGSLEDIYLIDEYGLLITPNNKYLVKGIKVSEYPKDIENQISMSRIENNKYDILIHEFQKYTRKKIILDENNNIKSISIIK